MTEHIYETKLVAQNGWKIHFPINDASPKEEIIRCRDCKHFLADHETYGNICFWLDDGGYDLWPVNTNGFCAWAEKKVD